MRPSTAICRPYHWDLKYHGKLENSLIFIEKDINMKEKSSHNCILIFEFWRKILGQKTKFSWTRTVAKKFVIGRDFENKRFRSTDLKHTLFIIYLCALIMSVYLKHTRKKSTKNKTKLPVYQCSF